MREYFTIMLKENNSENLGLLTEKLNDGYTVDRYIEVGRSTTVILEKYTRNTGDVVFNSEAVEPLGFYSGSATATLATRG